MWIYIEKFSALESHWSTQRYINVHARKWGSNSRNPIVRVHVDLTVSMVLQMVSLRVLPCGWIRTLQQLCLGVFFSSHLPSLFIKLYRFDYARAIDMRLVGSNQTPSVSILLVNVSITSVFMDISQKKEITQPNKSIGINHVIMQSTKCYSNCLLVYLDTLSHHMWYFKRDYQFEQAKGRTYYYFDRFSFFTFL